MNTLRELLDSKHSRAKAAAERLESGDLERARREFEVLRKDLAERGLESAFVFFSIAETWRRPNGLPPDRAIAGLLHGFECCCEAVRLDPVHPDHREQFADYGELLRGRLGLHSRFPHQPFAPQLYAVLLKAGEADASSHIHMAQYLASTDRETEALALLDSTVLLAPGRVDAWRLMAELAQKVGDEAAAARYSTRATELEDMNVPYGVPSPDSVC